MEEQTQTKRVQRWQDMGPIQQQLIAVMGAIQLSLLSAALVDLYWRPAEQIRGPKWLWTMAVFVSFVGPITYFTVGCKRT